MQLFLCEFQIKKNQIIIEDKDVLYQLRKVLRAKVGDIFFVQKKGNTCLTAVMADYRYEIQVESWDDKKLVGDIKVESRKGQVKSGKEQVKTGMIICMPNKWDKAEMIVQKLTEIGIDHIVFWPSERSIIKDVKTGKIERLKKIAKEAVEQSWGWGLPKIEFVRDFGALLKNSRLIVFDKKLVERNKGKGESDQLNIYGLIGPEGGLTENDYKKFGNNLEIKSLGENILRTETAAIIGAWEILNWKCGN